VGWECEGAGEGKLEPPDGVPPAPAFTSANSSGALLREPPLEKGIARRTEFRSMD